MSIEVVDDPTRHRFVVQAGDAEAELVYDRDPDRLYVLHTEVPSAFRGQGVARRLVLTALALAREDGLVVVPWCPFARRWLRQHPEAAEGVSIDWTIPPPTGSDGTLDAHSSPSRSQV